VTLSFNACTSVNPTGSNITVNAGQRVCITGTTVPGNVTVNPGGQLVMSNATVKGSVTASGAAGIQICGSSIRGAVTVQNSSGPVVIGDAPGCAGNQIGGAVTLSGNQSGVELDGNQIGGKVSVTGTTGGSTDVEANTIAGALSCGGNVPPPTNAGMPNTVSGARSGQCGAAGF
jgi:hypothetical protein